MVNQNGVQEKFILKAVRVFPSSKQQSAYLDGLLISFEHHLLHLEMSGNDNCLLGLVL